MNDKQKGMAKAIADCRASDKVSSFAGSRADCFGAVAWLFPMGRGRSRQRAS
jgi:hypothetical protein